MLFGTACVARRLDLAQHLHHEVISCMVKLSCSNGIAHEAGSSMLEQSMYTIKIRVFMLLVQRFASAVIWD